MIIPLGIFPKKGGAIMQDQLTQKMSYFLVRMEAEKLNPDTELAHQEADEILCHALRYASRLIEDKQISKSLYDLVGAYQQIHKWYA